MTLEETLAQMKSEMLSGAPFTYMGLSMKYFQEAGSRIVDREIQKMRRKGLIDYERRDGRPEWRAVGQPERQGAA